MTQNETGAALSPEFLDQIEALQDAMPTKVSQYLIEGHKNDTLDKSKMYFISGSPDLTKLNYVRKGKPILAEDGTPNIKGMGDGRVVKILRSLLSAEIVDKKLVDQDFEHFHNIYTSFYSTEDGIVEIWEGEAIYEAYSESNYYTGSKEPLYCTCCDYTEDDCECDEDDQDLVPGEEINRGTLWDSCMRHHTCIENRYFDIYRDHCKIAVLNCGGKVRARALVWVSTEGITFMDRIYSTEDRLIQKLIAFARLNKWDYKTEQSYSNKKGFFHYDPKLKTYRSSYWTHRVVLDPEKTYLYDNMPYMDTMTFSYIDDKDKAIYLINNTNKLSHYVYDYSSTSGGFRYSGLKGSCHHCNKNIPLFGRCTCSASIAELKDKELLEVIIDVEERIYEEPAPESVPEPVPTPESVGLGQTWQTHLRSYFDNDSRTGNESYDMRHIRQIHQELRRMGASQITHDVATNSTQNLIDVYERYVIQQRGDYNVIEDASNPISESTDAVLANTLIETGDILETSPTGGQRALDVERGFWEFHESFGVQPGTAGTLDVELRSQESLDTISGELEFTPIGERALGRTYPIRRPRPMSGPIDIDEDDLPY